MIILLGYASAVRRGELVGPSLTDIVPKPAGILLAAYGGVFVAGSLAWGMVFDGFKPDRWDVAGAVVCRVGVAVVMYAPRRA